MSGWGWDKTIDTAFHAIILATFVDERLAREIRFMEAERKVRSVTCPYCFVEHGSCVTRSGVTAREYHSDRWDVARGNRPPLYLIHEEQW